MRLALLGLPGAGKGTQAALLAGVAGVPHIATGAIFRQAVAAGTPLGRQVQDILEAGGLVPDAVTVEVLRERLADPDCASGFLLDGFPRTLGQAEALEALLAGLGSPLERVVYLDVPEGRVVARLSGRRVCARCGATYHVEADPPPADGRCGRCGGPVVQRADDAADVQRRRVATYRRDTEPLLGFYAGRGLLLRIDGDRPMAAVAAELAAGVGVTDGAGG